jgi:hypothetical protein
MNQAQRQARAVFLFQAREAHVIMQRELANQWSGRAEVRR